MANDRPTRVVDLEIGVRLTRALHRIQRALRGTQIVARLTQAHETKQLSATGSPREQIMRRVREQEEAVADSFGVKTRAPAQAKRAEVNNPPLASKTGPKSKPSGGPQPRLSVDRQLIKLAISTLVVIGTGLYLALASGTNDRRFGGMSLTCLPRSLSQLSPRNTGRWQPSSNAMQPSA